MPTLPECLDTINVHTDTGRFILVTKRGSCYEVVISEDETTIAGGSKLLEPERVRFHTECIVVDWYVEFTTESAGTDHTSKIAQIYRVDDMSAVEVECLLAQHFGLTRV